MGLRDHVRWWVPHAWRSSWCWETDGSDRDPAARIQAALHTHKGPADPGQCSARGSTLPLPREEDTNLRWSRNKREAGRDAGDNTFRRLISYQACCTTGCSVHFGFESQCYQSHFKVSLTEGDGTHSRTLAWKIPWTEEPGRLQSMGSRRVGRNWATSLSRVGEGNGNPLKCSCLENPRDRGAWWAAVSGVAQSRTQLKWLSRYTTLQTLFWCWPLHDLLD